jgi:TRAP-type C4-dicarboxylate transport system permease small subunit
MKNFVRYLKKAEEISIKGINIIFVLCFFGMLMLVIIEVIMRYVFAKGIPGGNELATAFFVYVSALGMALAIAKKEHIAIPAFVKNLKPGLAAIADALGIFLVLVISLIMLYYSIEWIAGTGSTKIPLLGILIPRWMFQLAIPAGLILSIIFCFLRILFGIFKLEKLGTFWLSE